MTDESDWQMEMEIAVPSFFAQNSHFFVFPTWEATSEGDDLRLDLFDLEWGFSSFLGLKARHGKKKTQNDWLTLSLSEFGIGIGESRNDVNSKLKKCGQGVFVSFSPNYMTNDAISLCRTVRSDGRS